MFLSQLAVHHRGYAKVIRNRTVGKRCEFVKLLLLFHLCRVIWSTYVLRHCRWNGESFRHKYIPKVLKYFRTGNSPFLGPFHVSRKIWGVWEYGVDAPGKFSKKNCVGNVDKHRGSTSTWIVSCRSLVLMCWACYSDWTSLANTVHLILLRCVVR